MVGWLSLLHNFNQQSQNSGFAQAQTMLTVCWIFLIVRISDHGPGLEIRLNTFCQSTIPQKQFIIIIIIIITIIITTTAQL